MKTRSFLLAATLLLAPGAPVTAQTLTLPALWDSATRADPRGRQLDLLSRQSALRMRSLSSERLPVVALEGKGQYQSDVPRVPVATPLGPPTPPLHTYDATALATQSLYHPTLAPRRRLEQAQLAQAQADVRSSLFFTRQIVNEAFFTALRAQAQADELRAALTALQSQHALAATRVREGTALPSEEHAVRAELLRRRQALLEASAARAAALDVLGEVTGLAIDTGATLQQPDFGAAVSAVRDSAVRANLRARPEYRSFELSREALRAQERARAAQDRPRVSAFGRAGYGQPGLNPLNDDFDTYWLAGLQLQWSPWSWGTNRRDREVLSVQRDIIATEEAAFTERLRRETTQELAAIERLESALALDEEIIALRERIAEETRIRFSEGAVTSAEYVDRQTDVLAARIARAIRRVELAHARARLVTTLGIEVR